MVAPLRRTFNSQFTDEKYQQLLDYVEKQYDHKPIFRIAETPIFIPDDLKIKLKDACEKITDVIVAPDFKEKSKGAMIPGQIVPNEDDHTIFLQMDFGICKNEDGSLHPQLIEVQGFPSLYFFQDLVADAYQKIYNIPEDYTHLFEGRNSEEYIELLRKVIVGDSKPEQVILLEVEPSKQATQIDFWVAEGLLGIKTICVSEVLKEGRQLFYLNNSGQKIRIEKIVNRVIFDELLGRKDLKRNFSFEDDLDVKWIGHPNWFYRISKHTLPYLKNEYVPESFFLNELKQIPEDLYNYVLKPLYSFAGTGVIINLNKYDIDAIKNPENFILQKKVEYAPVIETPSGPAKCEIRMLMIWEEGAARPRIINNLARISKGEMVGVRYNMDKDWVGGSVGLFKK